MDAEFADICDAVAATQRIKHKTSLLLSRKHAPQLVGHVLLHNHAVCWGNVDACNAATSSLSSLCFVRSCMRSLACMFLACMHFGLHDFGASYVQHMMCCLCVCSAVVSESQDHPQGSA